MQKPIRPESIIPAMVTAFAAIDAVGWSAWKTSVENTVASIAPEKIVLVYNHDKEGSMGAARDTYDQIPPTARAASVSVYFPAQATAALSLVGRPAGPCRIPIVAMSAQEQAEIRQILGASLLS